MARPNLLVLAIILALAAQAQGAPRPLAVVAYRPEGTAGKLISLPVSVDGATPRWFVLDSGAPRSAVDVRLATELKLALLKVTREGGTGHGTVAAGHPGPIRLGIGGVTLPVADPLTLDMASVPIQADDRGLVGSELFTAFVVQVDPIRRTLALYDPGSFRPDAGDVKLPLGVDPEHRRFYLGAVLRVRPGLVVSHRLRIDTGSEDSVDDPIVAQALKTTRTASATGWGPTSRACPASTTPSRSAPIASTVSGVQAVICLRWGWSCYGASWSPMTRPTKPSISGLPPPCASRSRHHRRGLPLRNVAFLADVRSPFWARSVMTF